MLSIFSWDLLRDMSVEKNHFTSISFSQCSVIVIPTVKIANHRTDREIDWPLIFDAKFKTGKIWIFFFFFQIFWQMWNVPSKIPTTFSCHHESAVILWVTSKNASLDKQNMQNQPISSWPRKSSASGSCPAPHWKSGACYCLIPFPKAGFSCTSHETRTWRNFWNQKAS